MLKPRRLTLAQIARHPLVLPVVGGVLRENIAHAFSKAALNDINISMSANSLDLVKGYVRMGYGAGIASLSPAIVSLWQESGSHDLQLRDVSSLFGTEPIVMIHRATGHEFTHVRAFREVVMKGMKAEA